jgi:OmpA-OmpF porin, OOP family
MAAPDDLTVNSLKHQIRICNRQQFTGRLDIEANEDQCQWCLYFSLGRLVWASGGINWLRRWYRFLRQYCPKVYNPNIGLTCTDDVKNSDYLQLIEWVQQHQITGAQATSIIRSTVVEVLFDILQQEEIKQLRIARDDLDVMDTALILLNPEHVLDSAQEAWDSWNQAGLAALSPNLALVVCQPEQLQQNTSPKVHQTLIAAIDGKRTLRELSLLLKQDLLLFTRMIGLYLQRGWLELVEVPAHLSPVPPQLSDALQSLPTEGPRELNDNAASATAAPGETDARPVAPESVQPTDSGTKSRAVPFGKWAVPILLTLAVGGGYAVWRTQSGHSSNPIEGLTKLSNSPDRMTIVGTDFSGHSTFRNAAFLELLKKAGANLNYQVASDEQSAELVNQGRADLELTTLDQFLQHQTQGKIVALIDHSMGADAVVLNTKRYPGLKSILDLSQLMQQARSQGQQLDIALPKNTPSEYLVMLLGAEFDGFKLSDFNIKNTPNTAEDWKLLHDPSQNLAVTVLREPDVTHARQQGYSVALSSQDVPEEIVDVLVASNRLIQSHPERITKLLEVYYRRVDADARDASSLKHQIAEESKLSPADAVAVMQGIQFYNALEANDWLKNSKLEKRIGSTAAILTLAGKIDRAPQAPKDLFGAGFVDTAANNTKALIRLVRASNPKLADRLAGKQITSKPKPTVSQLKSAPILGDLKLQWDVKFDEDSTHLTGGGKRTLNRIAQEISTEFNPQTVAVEVIGHTSKTGSASDNRTLSQQRAQVVVDYLRSLGLPHFTIAEGKGISQPLAGITPTDPRNQRTEIRLVHLSQ